MKSPDDASFQQWNENPEPSVGKPSPDTILDTDDATADAYLWESKNSIEGWLQFKGSLMNITD